MKRGVRAPGKAMLFGEYAVLEGAWGVVAAVDRYATSWLHDGPPASPFIAEAATAAQDYLLRHGRDTPWGWPHVDSSALYAPLPGGSTRKLGLGSSAAVTVAAFGAVLHAADVAVEDPEERYDFFLACDKAHAAAQGARGSGLDVAAAVWGGVLRARRGEGGQLEIESANLPEELAVVLVDTDTAASTADRVARFRALDRQSPPVSKCLHALTALADRCAKTHLANDITILVEDWNHRLEELERLMGIEILTPALRRIAALAQEMGGIAKPSGAGGGDLGVCFIPRDAADALRERLSAERFLPLEVQIEDPPQGLQDASLTDWEFGP